MYELTPSDRQFRAPLITPKAIVHGVQSALVVGKQGEEIDVDEEGRICVQFYWDRKKTASRRVRVAQQWAGGHRRGFLFIPRIGDEVLVQYEEGDPDRPVVVGSVYNGAEQTVAGLPAKKNAFGDSREIQQEQRRLQHAADSTTPPATSHVKLRAQKALIFKSLGDETRDINGSQTETVGGDETINIGGPDPRRSGNFTLNALQTITLNVGPNGSPLTQIVMTTSSITLNIGPSGMMHQIVMDATGITLAWPRWGYPRS